MAISSSDDSYLDPYRQSVAQHGTGFEAALWANRESQRLRFEVFTQLAYLPGRRILDAGCGRGDFATYLIDRGIEFERFIGVDALGEVIEFAQGRGLAGCEFHQGDLVNDAALFRIGEPEIVCVSGTLNTMTDEQARRVLEAAWAGAQRVMMFNFLSSRAGDGAVPQTGPARRMDPLMWMDWALTRTSDVVFRQDYFPHGHDATICMRKGV